MSRFTDIEPGQRFRSAGLTAFGKPLQFEWVVDRLWSGNDGIHYARLVEAADRARSKLISTTALADRNFYVPSPFECRSASDEREARKHSPTPAKPSR